MYNSTYANILLQIQDSSESTNDKINVMWTFYSSLMGEKHKRSGTSGLTAAAEVNAYLEEPLCLPSTDVFQYWKNHSNFPRLRQLSRKFLSIPPATVYSERLFSTAGLVVDRKRSRLDPDKVKMLIFLNKNLK